MASKKTQGRKKIELKKIEDEEDRLITFSKRRSGIYKKASELITLTGVEIAFVTYSPKGKPFSFAHPSIDAVANRFFGHEPNPNDQHTQSIIEAHRQARIDELNAQYNDLIRELDMLKVKEKELTQKVNGEETKGWWSANVEELKEEELLQLGQSFEDVQKRLKKCIFERTNGASTSSDPSMIPTQMVNLFVSNANEANPPLFPPGSNYNQDQ